MKKYQRGVFEILWLYDILNKGLIVRSDSSGGVCVCACVCVCVCVCVCTRVRMRVFNSLNPGSKATLTLHCDRQHHTSNWYKAVTQDEMLFENSPFGVHALSGVRRKNQGM